MQQEKTKNDTNSQLLILGVVSTILAYYFGKDIGSLISSYVPLF